MLRICSLQAIPIATANGTIVISDTVTLNQHKCPCKSDVALALGPIHSERQH